MLAIDAMEPWMNEDDEADRTTFPATSGWFTFWPLRGPWPRQKLGPEGGELGADFCYLGLT
jgi:hypothetical protein